MTTLEGLPPTSPPKDGESRTLPPRAARRHRSRLRSVAPLKERSQSADQLGVSEQTPQLVRGLGSNLHSISDSRNTVCSDSCRHEVDCEHHSIHHHHHRHRRHHRRQYHSDQSILHHHHHHHHHSDIDHHHHQPHLDQSNDPHLHHHQDNHHHHQTHHHDTNESQDQPRRRRHRHRSRHNESSSVSSSTINSSASSHSASTTRRVRSASEPRDSDLAWEERMASGLNLSLCGCGFLGIYHLGVASCLVKHGPSFLASLEKVAGASAGALVAALLVTAPDLSHVEASTEIVTAMAKSIRRKPLGAITPGYRVSDDLKAMLDKLLPHDAHEIARGKLYVSMTNVKTKKNEVMSDFASRQELIEALIASCHIPVYSGLKLPKFRGQRYCDGGLTDNLVRFPKGRTITVSPFSGKQDIGPRDSLKKGTKGMYVNLHNQDMQVNFNNVRRLSHAFFPPKSYILQQYFELGHKDASRFLVRENLYEIIKPDKKPVVYESSV